MKVGTDTHLPDLQEHKERSKDRIPGIRVWTIVNSCEVIDLSINIIFIVVSITSACHKYQILPTVNMHHSLLNSKLAYLDSYKSRNL